MAFYDIMKADILIREKVIYDDGSLVEMVIWRVPEPVQPSLHSFKYRLVYIVGGKRMIGYDNERGKGDHRHIEDQEFPYAFVSIETLLDQFVEDVETMRSET